MAVAFGSMNVGGYNKFLNSSKNRRKVSCSYSSSSVSNTLTDQYRTLRIQPGASESEVRKAFRSLALQYHPDVCKGNNCGVQFHQINEAYDLLMSNLRGETRAPLRTVATTATTNEESSRYEEEEEAESLYEYDPYDPEDMEVWMGWEGAGVWDYSSQVNSC